ncbi:serine/threonine protein kinase [Nitzschia inconspicua]|uniref:Serine/threonine protein kinase n=1 Tax=Nitzschia inconspicua TaxID=303405 RepID=A0A9K3K666_9STRA|nr:serine/threonine protein kinase [Nitzschia inconspicua]
MASSSTSTEQRPENNVSTNHKTTTTTSSIANNTMPPPGLSTLEQKLELLEARFTQPLLVGVFPPEAGQTQHSNLSEHSFHFSASTTTSSSTGGIIPNNNYQQQHHPINNSTSNSNSLFGGSCHDGLLSSSMTSFSSNSNNSISSNSNHHNRINNHSSSPSSSKQQYSTTNRRITTASLELVNEAAAKHMRKVAVRNALSPSNATHSNSSQQTLVTGNHYNNNNNNNDNNGNHHPKQTSSTTTTTTATSASQPPNRVVAESPPIVMVSPHMHSGNNNGNRPFTSSVNDVVDANDNNNYNIHVVGTTAAAPITVEKPPVARKLLANHSTPDAGTATTPTASTTATTTKRKSQPKRKVSSVQDSLTANANDLGTVVPTTATVNPTGTSPPKRPRTTATATPPPQPSTTATNDATSTTTSRDSFSNNPVQNTNWKRSPRTNPTTYSEHSRDRSNPGRSTTSNTNNNNTTTNNSTTNSKRAAQTALPPPNNKRIHDYFFSAVSNPKRNNNNNNNPKHREKGPAAGKAYDMGPKSSNATTPSTAVTTVTSSSVSPSPPQPLIDWEAQCNKLQQQLDDKDEQLKAVTNNKTILHTALQAALTKTKQELESVQQTMQQKQDATGRVLEELLRWRSQQQAKHVRETLAADGARLGKVVYTRAGMRAVESWEEGYATKDLLQRKEDWKRKMRRLLERQEQWKQQQQQQQQQPANNKEESITLPPDTSVTTRLDVEQAREAMEMHMETLRREDQELVAADQALNDEKAAHIRALKLVEAEDSSRFNHRPKLHDRYVLDSLLGKGGFSEVWRAYDLKELREVAVKIHQLDPRWPDSKKDNYTKHVTREYEIHRDVRHPRIVSLFDVFEIDANSFATVLECCKGTDLDTMLKSKKRLPERHARAILLQILSGMQYLSQPSGSRQGIIHYDLKPGNILFDEAGDAKITDFGLSKIVDAPDPAESMELTSQGKTQDKILADHTMLNANEVHIPDKPAVSDGGKEFLRLCLTYDQAFRPTVAQICENRYVLEGGAIMK